MSEVAEQEFLHVECDCVPNLGPSHCHLCTRPEDVAVWPCAYADAMSAHDERVRGEERERCAQIAEYAPEYRGAAGGEEQARMIAAAIRAVSAEQGPARHRRHPGDLAGVPFCMECHRDWPCPSSTERGPE